MSQDPLAVLLGMDEPARLSWTPAVSRGRQQLKAIWNGQGKRPPIYGERARRALQAQARKDRATPMPSVAQVTVAPAPAVQETVEDQIRQLASGTLASLTGKTGYADLDRFRDELRTWAINGKHLGKHTWQDVANAFLEEHPHWKPGGIPPAQMEAVAVHVDPLDVLPDAVTPMVSIVGYDDEPEVFDSSLKHKVTRGWTPAEVLKDMQTASTRYNFGVLARDEGYASNGRYLFKIPPKDLGAYVNGTMNAQGRAPDMEAVAEFLNAPTEETPAEVEGYRFEMTGKRGKMHQYLLSSGQRKLVVDAKYLETIKRAYPGAQMYFPKKKNQPVVFKEGDVPVGLLMPFHEDRAKGWQVKDKSAKPKTMSLVDQLYHEVIQMGHQWKSEPVRMSDGQWKQVKGKRGSDKLWKNVSTGQEKYFDGDPNKGAKGRNTQKAGPHKLKKLFNKKFPRWQRTGSRQQAGVVRPDDPKSMREKAAKGTTMDSWLKAATGETREKERGHFLDRVFEGEGNKRRMDHKILTGLRKARVMAWKAHQALEKKTGGLPTRVKLAIAQALSSDDFVDTVMDVVAEGDVSKMAMKAFSIVAGKLYKAVKSLKGKGATKLSLGDDWTPMRALPYFRFAVEAVGGQAGLKPIPDGVLLGILSNAWEGEKALPTLSTSAVDQIFEAMQEKPIKLGWQVVGDAGDGKKIWKWDKQGERPKGSTVRKQIREPGTGRGEAKGKSAKAVKSPAKAANKSQGQGDSSKENGMNQQKGPRAHRSVLQLVDRSLGSIGGKLVNSDRDNLTWNIGGGDLVEAMQAAQHLKDQFGLDVSIIADPEHTYDEMMASLRATI